MQTELDEGDQNSKNKDEKDKDKKNRIINPQLTKKSLISSNKIVRIGSSIFCNNNVLVISGTTYAISKIITNNETN